MNLEENETTSESMSLGQTLAKARAEQNLSFDDIAARLKLNHTQITKLENDEYQSLGPETFVRGYVKSYSAFLGLESEQVLALYESSDIPEQKRNMKSFSRRTEKEANDSRLMIVSYLMLVVFVGLSAFWWWQTASNGDSSDDVSGLTEQASASSSVAAARTLERSTGLDTQAINTPVQNTDTANLNMPASEPQPVIDNTIAEVVPGDESDSGVMPERTAEVAPIVIEDNGQSVQNEPIAAVAVESNATALEQSTVVMFFEEDSWVEIFDATEERVAFGVKKAGYTMTVTGQAPFSVVLGKHQVVNIELDGQPVDISGLPRNRLAKFKLPLAE
ncbi:RodZ domain-containing protein [Pseudoalteromonas luteoviolacea]|uniref:Cytoskeleton protein RodZ-like C-terminal domain-containing protein n=1 Tax=Pseudoalteromonas luteoviolacea H33 TaxID=1365251 RepID=A0A167F8W5_9GAMM|nr:RodZ domain-containing protein [Pseudoalteromonas luteoviolacea]KZN51918.1 hypothetical protein N476_00930 [Pseudoalteromonas luteoviolacea H33]KZN78634.1 hypothetical protein N477_07405 [Pseudoalteromonas luteoviolacea H33-S]MBQ4875998.1 DUF4115 domain-containing protein [Pseudoalteromonas luteoviolacea]MBQ4905633.1 DUF4115 domain-containing protein [Pseudoalteromonas luteoviolacea]